jgi:hypothetical protein
VAGLEDAEAEVRRSAAEALAAFGEQSIHALLAALGDEDLGVREMAARALAAIGSPAVPGLLAALEDEPRDEAALLALLALPASDPGPVRAYGRRQVERALHYHRLWLAFAGRDDVRLGLLAHALRRRALAHASRAVLAHAPPDDYGEVRLALDGVESRDPNQRAGAVETLETAGPRETVGPLLGVWDPDERPPGNRAHALAALLEDDDAWLRACAALAAQAADDAGAVEADALAGAVRRAAQADRDPLVRETAARTIEGGAVDTLTVMDRVLALRQVPLFRELGPEDLRHVAEASLENRYPDGTVIAEHGDPGEAMHVVVSGDVRVLVEQGSQVLEVARRGPGYIVGEMAILSQEPRMASLIAEGDVRTLSIDRKRFQRILRERPDAALAVMRELCARLREANVGGPGAVIPR